MLGIRTWLWISILHRENLNAKENNSVPWCAANPVHELGITLFIPWSKEKDGVKLLKKRIHAENAETKEPDD